LHAGKTTARQRRAIGAATVFARPPHIVTAG
jgi:hypothetical protein